MFSFRIFSIWVNLRFHKEFQFSKFFESALKVSVDGWWWWVGGESEFSAWLYLGLSLGQAEQFKRKFTVHMILTLKSHNIIRKLADIIVLYNLKWSRYKRYGKLINYLYQDTPIYLIYMVVAIYSNFASRQP